MRLETPQAPDQPTRPRNRYVLLTGLMVIVAALAVFWPVVGFVVYEEVDYSNHLSYLQDRMDGAAIERLLSMFPHFLFHLSVYAVYKVLALATIHEAAVIVTIAVYVFGALAVFGFLVRLLGRPPDYHTCLLYAAVTLALMLVMPVNLLTPDNLYLGYIVIHAYHNPTMPLLKPFAVLLFGAAGNVFMPEPAHDVETRDLPIWAVVIVTVLCILAKPNYVIALLPALAVMTAYSCWRRQTMNWNRLAAIVLPAVFVLFNQALLFQNSGGIMFAPLAVMQSWGVINPNAANGLLPKFILSVLFPAAVYLGYFKYARRSVYLNLAWLTFGAGAAYSYLLAEGSDRLGHANFTWSGQISLFVLFVMSTIFLIRHNRPVKRRAILLVCCAAFSLHLISGLYWYDVHLTSAWMGAIISGRW